MLATIVSAAVVTLGLASLAPVSRVSGSPAQPAPTAEPTDQPRPPLHPSPCYVTYTKTAAPEVVLLGDAVSVTLTTRTLCAGERRPTRIVLLLDGSAAMAGEPGQRMRQAAGQLVRYLDLENDPSRLIGVAMFGSGTARALCALGSSEAELRTCIHRVGAQGLAAAAPGLREASRMLGASRGGNGTADIEELIVLLSVGALDDCQEAAAAARTAKGRGAVIAAVCVADDCASSCLRDLASSPALFLRDRPMQPLFRFVDDHTDRIEVVHVDRLDVRDALGPDVTFVPHSAVPRSSEPGPSSSWIAWHWSYRVPETVTMSYRVRPTRTGPVPLNAAASGQLTDSRGRDLSWSFPVAWVTVLGAAAPPPTPTTSPSATRTGPALATATPTATGAPRRNVYLPVARSR